MSIEWKKDEVKDKLNRLLDNMVKVAMEDDVISQDEQDIIDTMRKHVLSFEDQITQMIEQHDHVDAIVKQSKNFFERAIEATARQARKDGTITSEELVLIDRMTKSLRRDNLSKYFE